MRKFVIAGVAAFAVVAGGWFAYGWWTVDRFFESTDNAYVQSDITMIGSQVEGRVVEVFVGDNQAVQAGDPLLKIDDRDFRAALDQAQAAADAQTAALATIDSQIALQSSVIAQAQAGVEEAAATLQQAENDLERARRLMRTNAGSQQSFETAGTEVTRDRAALARAEATLAAERGRVDVLKASRQEGVAQLARLQAAVELAGIDLDRTLIAAPVAGVVGNRGVEVGQHVRPGVQLLALVPLPEIYVVANFKETQLAGMRVGQPVALSIDAFPGETLTGRLESFAPASGSEFSLLPPENATGNFTKVVQRVPVRIAVPRDNPLSGFLRPGLSVEASVDTREAGTGEQLAGGIFGTAQAAELP